jgi:hypothetical protein
MKAILIFMVMMTFTSITEKDKLTGRWETKPSAKGNTTGIVFKEDNSFEAYINKKPFVTGTYVFQDSIFSFTDNGCNGARGIYKIIFFSEADSMRFEPVSDSCTERKQGMIRTILGRVKK